MKDAVKINRWQDAGLIGKLLHSWIFRLLWFGQKVNLDESDLYDCHENYKSEFLAEKLEKRWNEELDLRNKGKIPSFSRAVLSTFKVDLLFLVTIVAFQNCLFRILQSITLHEIVLYFSIPNPTTYDHHKFLVMMFTLWVAIFGYSFLANHGFAFGSSIGTKIKTAITFLVFKKVTKLGLEDTTDASSGQIVNLISNSVNRIEIAAKFCAFTVVAPLQLLISTVLLWQMVGIGTLAGTGAFIIQFVCQIGIGKIITKMRKKTSKITDERVRMVSEIFSAIRIIKMYSIQSPLFLRLKEVRHLELAKKLVVSVFNGTVSDFAHAFGKLGVFFSLTCHFWIFGLPFTSEGLFLCTSVFENLRLSGRMFAFAISYRADTIACFKKVQEILLTKERKPNNYTYSARGSNPLAVSVKDLTASWARNSKCPAITGVTVNIRKGELVAVVGSIASGKSSFLMSLMGELIQNEGSIEVQGKIAYVPQEPWLINKSIKDNVLLFSSFNNTQYERALIATTLDKDIEKMEYRHNTPVGERGNNLSGGQKARVNLARAVCTDADILLLDDPLSAVDAAVAKTIFHDCIRDFLREKTRILVTHQVQFLHMVDKIMVVEKGHLIACGTYDQLVKQGVPLGVSSHDENDTKVKPKLQVGLTSPEQIDLPSPLSSETESNFQVVDITEEEEDVAPPKPEPELSRISAFKVFVKYFSAAGGCTVILLLLLLGFCAQACFSLIDLYLSSWSGGNTCFPEQLKIQNITGKGPDTSQCPAYAYLLTSQQMYYWTYMVIAGCLLIFWILRSSVFHVFCNVASRVLHKKAVLSLLYAPVSFFDVNPLGRILNRITKDVGNIDDVLPFMLSEGYLAILMLVGYMVVILIFFPLMLVGFGVLLTACFLFGKFYIKPGRDLQRLEATTSSPVYSMMGITLKGLPIVRSQKGEDLFFRRFALIQNKQTSAAICSVCAGAFYRTGVEFFSMVFLASIFITLTASTGMDAQISGLTLNSSTQIGISIQYISLMVLQVITLMISVERVLDYKKLEPERESAEQRKPPDNWPYAGEIEFKNVNMKYTKLEKEDKTNTFVAKETVSLKNLNFVIKAGEKVGIVGRSGAGKSSIISALMRLHETDGEVLVDGIKTSDISLYELRSRISVIPQEPVLFTGTLRYSLDPFGRYTDSRIQAALRMVKMEEKIWSDPRKLDMEITDGGSNFSMGEKQLLCLAKAILLRNRILLLDEASASLDYQSDELIQTTIRHNFHDCTTMTVAHRLGTIIDSDRVMVMHAGELMEFDAPHILLQNRESFFSDLVRKTGPAQETELRKAAEEAYWQRIRREGKEEDVLLLDAMVYGKSSNHLEMRFV